MIALRIFLISTLLVLSGCAEFQKLPPEQVLTVYMARDSEGSVPGRYAPVFLPYDYQNTYNRIGRPVATLDGKGQEQISVDPRQPAIYYMERSFSTDKGNYRNLIYRLHFPEVPFSLIPFHLTTGNNVGLMVVITLDEQERPVLVTTVHTCGCYLAIVPTSHLPRDALPVDWKEEPLRVYGERLPWLLEYRQGENPRLLVHLRPGVHRVIHLEVIEERDVRQATGFTLIHAPLIPASELERIPLEDRVTSFYYREGLREGHVKGSIKPWESILLSLITLDFFVGSDKVYGDRRETGNTFYTSLKPWNREASDMWNFERFLKFWGWRL